MKQLAPCKECRRHVDVRSAACPFCLAPRAPSDPREFSFRRASRAGVFAGAALVASACGGKKGGDTTPPPPPPTADAGATGETSQVDAAAAELPPPDPREMAKPYGAPPARRRVV
jgi:hypothetical protein